MINKDYHSTDCLPPLLLGLGLQPQSGPKDEVHTGPLSCSLSRTIKPVRLINIGKIQVQEVDRNSFWCTAKASCPGPEEKRSGSKCCIYYKWECGV